MAMTADQVSKELKRMPGKMWQTPKKNPKRKPKRSPLKKKKDGRKYAPKSEHKLWKGARKVRKTRAKKNPARLSGGPPKNVKPAPTTLAHHVKAKLSRAGYQNVRLGSNKAVRTVSFDAYKGKKKVRRSISLGKLPSGKYYVGAGSYDGQWSDINHVPGIAVTKATQGFKASPPFKAKKRLGFFSNPTQAKRQMKKVTDIFADERKRAAAKHPKLAEVGLQLDPHLHDSPRHFAATHKPPRKAVVILVAPELASEPVSVIRGIIRHEFGHAHQLLGGGMPQKGTKALPKYDVIERDADRKAERIFDCKIYYDARGVEVAGPGARGQRPRPKGLK